VKYLKEDKEKNSRTYHYRARGEDHYYHAFGYALYASNKIKVHEKMTTEKMLMEMIRKNKQDTQSPLSHGLGDKDSNPLNYGLSV
jgi:hypothetical protein